MNNNSGIYAITSPSGKQYIGSTVNFDRRWSKHIRQLRNGTHPNAKLRSAFAKYGSDELKFSKLLICDQEFLLEYEQLIINHLSPEYNIAIVVSSPMYGRIHSAETRNAMSRAGKGKAKSAEHRASLSLARTTSGLHGVYFDKCTSYWQARITVGADRKFLGLYETAELANEAIVAALVASNFEAWDADRKSKCRPFPRNNTSGFKGVTWDKSREKWCAQIKVCGKKFHLGRYSTIELANQARLDAEARILQGLSPRIPIIG